MQKAASFFRGALLIWGQIKSKIDIVFLNQSVLEYKYQYVLKSVHRQVTFISNLLTLLLHRAKEKDTEKNNPWTATV